MGNVFYSEKSRAMLGNVQWLWVFLAGVSPPLLSAVLAMLVSEGCSTFVYSALKLSKAETSRILDLCETTSMWGAFLLNALFTLGTAAWAARQAGKNATMHGIWIGLVSMLTILILGLTFGLHFRLVGAPQEKWNLGMLALTVCTGWLGGLNANVALRRREALYATSRAIGTAHSHQTIVDAIGKYLAGGPVSHVFLWQTDPPHSDLPITIHLLAAWVPHDTQPLSPGLVLDSNDLLSLARLRGNEPVPIQTTQVSRAER
ncbi:MAG: hypothetical protein JXA89_19415, partial [Anaerolineae bacterium]|nr:hypothetical protein [Anaerolineae bacterium]